MIEALFIDSQIAAECLICNFKRTVAFYPKCSPKLSKTIVVCVCGWQYYNASQVMKFLHAVGMMKDDNA